MNIIRCVFIAVLLILFNKDYVFASYECTASDIIEIASTLNSEANTEPDKGKRLVVDVILNRVDSKDFPSNVEDVINQDNQFTIVKKAPTYENLKIVCDEVNKRTNSDVLFFRTERYHEDTKPITREGKHYFSGLK